MQNETIWRLSWIAYLKDLIFIPIGSLIISGILMVVFSIITALLSSFYFEPSTIEYLDSLPIKYGVSDKMLVFYIFLALFIFMTLLFYILGFLGTRSIKLYLDEDGVWMYSGIFPWNKGINGIKWRDLDTALYTTGLLSWVYRSYKIYLTHRFTKSSEIILKDVARGDLFVKAVNEYHENYVRENAENSISGL